MAHTDQRKRTDLGVYVHVPFAHTKCTYCDSPSGVFPEGIDEIYVDALCEEIRSHARFYREANLTLWQKEPPGFAIETAYIGGGIPSLLGTADLARVVEALRATFPGPLSEISLEADPETATEKNARAWRGLGVNRISLAVQSFSDVELTAIGRSYRRDDIFRSLDCLQAAGFKNYNLELVVGLPHQTEKTWQASLAEALHLEPPHISIYMLDDDKTNPLMDAVPTRAVCVDRAALPCDEAIASFYEFARTQLSRWAYEHYEISNWARPGFRSRHNVKYWRREPYLGFGAGASSFDGAERWTKSDDPVVYVASVLDGRLPIRQRELIRPQQALAEELFLGLRQLDGIDLHKIERRYKVNLCHRVEPLAEEGLVELRDGRLRLAPAHLAVSNEVFARLIE